MARARPHRAVSRRRAFLPRGRGRALVEDLVHEPEEPRAELVRGLSRAVGAQAQVGAGAAAEDRGDGEVLDDGEEQLVEVRDGHEQQQRAADGRAAVRVVPVVVFA